MNTIANIKVSQRCVDLLIAIGHLLIMVRFLFLIDFLQCLQPLLALGMEDQNALFHYFALLALAGVAALNDQRLFLLPDLSDDCLKFIRLFLAALGAEVEVSFQAGKEVVLFHSGFPG